MCLGEACASGVSRGLLIKVIAGLHRCRHVDRSEPCEYLDQKWTCLKDRVDGTVKDVLFIIPCIVMLSVVQYADLVHISPEYVHMMASRINECAISL